LAGVSDRKRAPVEEGRHHTHETILQSAIEEAVSKTTAVKHVGCHTFRYSFATHLLEADYDIRTIHELLGYKDVSTTMICTHLLSKGGHGVPSPVHTLSSGLHSLHKTGASHGEQGGQHLT